MPLHLPHHKLHQHGKAIRLFKKALTYWNRKGGLNQRTRIDLRTRS